MARPRTKIEPVLDCKHCGQPFRARSWPRPSGEPYVQRYCSGTCRNHARGPARGYIHKRTGYRVFNIGKRMVAEHTLVMEKKIGRKLHAKETVHHINGDRADNRPENLELWSSRHGRGQRVADLPPTCASDFAIGALSLGG